ncbi:unnamed protein product, partial [Adineta ricciae]
MYKFGPRCFLKDKSCELHDNTTCNNRGQCIPSDLNRQTSQLYTCICSKGYDGIHCEYEDNEISLTFEKKIHLLQTIFIHFLYIENNLLRNRLTIFKTILSMKYSTNISWTDRFNVIFIEDLKKNYYLLATQKTIFDHVKLNKQLQLTDR